MVGLCLRADPPPPGERSRRALPGEGEAWLGIESVSFIIIAGRDDCAAKCLDILCKFRDQPKEPYPPDYYRACFTEEGRGKGREFDYFRQVSYGRADMVGSKVFGWFAMSGHATAELASLHYPGDRRKLAEWGIALAGENHLDLAPFWGVLVVYNFQTDSGYT